MSVYVFVAFAAVFVKGYLWIISKQYTWAGPRWYLLVAAFLVGRLFPVAIGNSASLLIENVLRHVNSSLVVDLSFR